MSDLVTRFKSMPPLVELVPPTPVNEAMSRAIAHLQAGEHVVLKFANQHTRNTFRSSLFTRLIQMGACVQWEEKISTCRAWNGTCALLSSRSPFWDVPVANSMEVA